MSERIMLFVDHNNLHNSLKGAVGNHRYDAEKLCSKLVGTRKLVRAYWYVLKIPQEFDKEVARATDRFVDALSYLPYTTVRRGRLIKAGGSWKDKGTDVRLAIDMVASAYEDHYDTAILVSGDSDYIDAVNIVKARGKHVENAIASHGKSLQLVQASDKFIGLDKNFMKNCWRK